MSTLAERAVARTPRRLTLRFGGMSDKAIAWLFITPSVLLSLAINIFPLLWTIQLSFTNYRANRPNAHRAMSASTISRHPHRSRSVARDAGDRAFRAVSIAIELAPKSL